jgi:hypothetical protein
MIGLHLPELDLGGTTGYVLLISMFCLFFLTFEAIFLSFAKRSAARSDVSRRMLAASPQTDGQASLIKTRRRRSLTQLLDTFSIPWREDDAPNRAPEQ